MNPLEVMFASGATFLARGTSHGLELLKKIFKEAILHKGFSLVDVLQVCVTFDNLYEYYDKRVYELKDHNPSDETAAAAKIREWDYDHDAKIPLGVMYKREAETFDGRFEAKTEAVDRDIKIREYLGRRI